MPQTTLQAIKDATKCERNFNTQEYISKKIARINGFFSENKLDAAVIGISGGIDSAVVAALLIGASRQPNSPLKRVVGLSLPIHSTSGVTAQAEAETNAKKVADAIGLDLHILDLRSAQLAYEHASLFVLDDKPIETPNAWVKGQLASIVRTPMLYFAAAHLQQIGYKSIVVGTTNRDEGSYIGFFGKASDAMVDLQPIADIHKSEVRKVAERLGIPDDIVRATPRGDVWDARVDEEMIGAPYWFLEMYLLYKQYDMKYASYLNANELELWNKYADNIERLHKQNEHKYKVGSPAHFIDVMTRKVKGGWQ